VHAKKKRGPTVVVRCATMKIAGAVDLARLGLLRVASVALMAGMSGTACGGREIDEAPAMVQSDGGGGGAEAAPSHAQLVPTQNGLQSIWGSSEADIWAVGDSGTIVHFDGSAWTLVDSGVTDNLTSVRGTGPSDVWAVGDAGSVLHWDGSAWTVVSQVGLPLLGLWAFAPDDVWAVGVDFGGFGGSGFVHHWTGASTGWQDADVPGTDTLWRVWGSGSHDVWLAGASSGAGATFHGDGMNFDSVAFTGDPLHGIWGSGPDDVWATTSTGSIEHWTGSAWSPAPALSSSGQGLFGVGGSGPDDVWTVGVGGVVAHYAAGSWTISPTPTIETLFSVWSDTPSNAWLVGAHGTILRWSGAAWQ
jgi:hypothetical protein